MNTVHLMLLLAILWIVAPASNNPVIVHKLNSNWKLNILDGPRQAGSLKGKQYNATIPTTVHLDLLKHKEIQDPFYGGNYPSLEWVSDCQIKYSTNFKIQDSELELEESQLVFEGIDTYGTIILNGKEILKTENAFRQYVVNVNGMLRNQNNLEIIIDPTKLYDEKGQRENAMPFKYAHTRKACYQYSWDWAPYLNTLGIWKDVYVRLYEKIRFDYVWARNKQIASDEAIINFAIKFGTNPYGENLEQLYSVAVFHKDEKLNSINITENTAYLDVAIKNPSFWWPNGIGQPYIYDFVVIIFKGDHKIDERKVPYGIKIVELDTTNRQFKVKINGYPIYCKGANYVPPDMFYPRLTNPDHSPQNSIQKLLDDALESNFNMLRVWGGGQYESDEFLQLASRKGIMIFYDFMFSDSIYPSSEGFLINVEEQIKQQIRRARNYPSLVLWCGNNQILQGIQDWGWGRSNYKNDYKILFQTLIKRVVDIESPYIPYIPSSPVYGVGNYGFDRGGDFHFWGVWAGGSPFESYQKAIGPFNSEFGTQALPVWETIKAFTKENERNYNSGALAAHQRHGSRFGTLQNYMKMYMNPSANFEKEVYLSSVVQAFAIEIAIRAQRSAKPKSYGTLYWQFNDAWPAISWSSIDYYGRWKALQYMAKRSYPDIAIFLQNNLTALAINDKLEEVEASIQVRVLGFDGSQIHSVDQVVNLMPDSVKQVAKIDGTLISGKETESFAVCDIFVSGKKTMRSTFFFKHFKELKLPEATLKVEYNLENNQLILSSEKLIKNLYISNSEKYIKLSDNYFDLIPKEATKVQLVNQNLSQLKDTMKYVSVREGSLQEDLKVES